MPASFQELLNSRLFKFVVGEKADGSSTVFSVHQEAIAQLSQPLYDLTQEDKDKFKVGYTVWDDVKKDTFERLAQFAYTGDYSVPKTEKRTRDTEKEVATNANLSNLNGIHSQCEVEEVFAIEEPTPLADDVVEEEAVMEAPPGNEYSIPADVQIGDLKWGYWECAINKKKAKKKTKETWIWKWGPNPEPEPVPEPEPEPVPESEPDPEPEPIIVTRQDKYPRHSPPIHSADFHSLSFELLAPRNNHDKTCDPTEYFEPGQSYSNVFLCHASLYVLADYRLIDSLKALALFKLHKTMCVFELDDSNAEDIVDLARYVYSEENGATGVDGGIGGLRKLVCQYMATNALALSFDDGFMELLAEGGQFVKDFFKFEVQRTS